MNKKAQIEMYFGSQLYEAWMPKDMGSSGMGSAVLTRKTVGGAVASINSSVTIIAWG